MYSYEPLHMAEQKLCVDTGCSPKPEGDER